MTNEEKKLVLARARAFVRDGEQDEPEALEASCANSERCNRRSENHSAVDPEKPATADFRPHFDPVRRQWPRPEPPKPERKLDTMPIDWQERIDAAIESERATTYEVIAHAVAETTAEYERQLAELRSEVESLKADHTAAHLQQFGQKLDATLAKASELVERLDRSARFAAVAEGRAGELTFEVGFWR
jgi:hypothetical protein